MSTASILASDRSVTDLNTVETPTGGRWLGVEFRHLGAVAAVAREGSFRGAAESLGYAKSSISGQVAHVERAVGIQLVERSNGSGVTTLTRAGRVLLGHVEEILARFEAARADLQALAQGTDSSVRIGVLEGIGERRLPRILQAFAARFPESDVVIDESCADEQNFERLATGEIDVMITELPLPPGPFDHTVLERDEYVLLVAADSPLAGQSDALSAEQLSRLPLILPAPVRRHDRLAMCLHENVVDELRPRSVATVQALVGAGLGAAIVPRLAVVPDDLSTVSVELESMLPPRLIALVKHREREYSASVQGFIEITEAQFNPSAAALIDSSPRRLGAR